MKKLHPVWLVVSLALLAGCSSAVVTTGEPAVQEAAAQPTLGTPEACLNPLYPVRQGAYWRYAARGASGGDYSFTHTLSEVSREGFSLDIQYSTGVSVQNSWTCVDGDLLVLDAPGGPAGSLASTGGTFASIETGENAGVTLPAAIEQNDAWEQGMHVSGEVNLPDGTSGLAEGEYNAEYMAMGVDTVTVPAGTFEALLIQAYVVYDLTVSVEGVQVAAPLDMMVFLWYAEGVGLVRSEVSSSAGGSEVIELTSYFIP